LRNKDNSLVVLLHSSDIKNPLKHYKKRWKIEFMFKLLKSSGFNIEKTNIKDPKRLGNLLLVASITFCFAAKAGEIISSKTKPKLKKHGYPAKSVVRIGLDWLTKIIRTKIKKKPDKTYKKDLLILNQLFVM